MIRDVFEEDKKMERPEIRVWCCPVRGDGDPGKSDYYYTFDSLFEARQFAAVTPAAEDEPLLAYDGYEMTAEEFNERYPALFIG